MNQNNEDLYTFQLLHFFVSRYQYQIVTIRQQKQEKWLMNPQHTQFPVIYLTALSDEQLAQRMETIQRIHQVILRMIRRDAKLLVLNTSSMCSNQNESAYINVPIQPGLCGDPQVEALFVGLADAVYDAEEPQKEFIKITHALEEIQAESFRQQRKQGFFKQMPKLTVGIVGLCMVIWLLVALLSAYLENDIMGALLGGAYYKMNIISLHEYWRMITAGFLHLDVIHLLCNMMALYSIGRACERSYTKIQYVLILLGSIITGNLFVFLTEGNTICLGISGGVFGLFGALIATMFADGSIKNPMIRASVMRLLFMNALISLLPGISLFAHLGGFVAGAFMGVIFTKEPRWARLRIHVTISFAILIGFSFGLASDMTLIEPLDRNIDRAYYHTVRALGLDSYAERIQNAYLQYYTKEELGI